MRISEFIEQCNREESPEGVLSLMQRAVGDIGFDRYAYCALTGHDRYLPGNKPAPAIALNFPTSWTDYYFERRYQTIDPVIVNAPRIERPFLWDSMSTRYRLTRGQTSVMNQAREARLRDGVGVPLHGPFGSVCLLTFAAGDGHPDAKAFLANLAILSAQFHLAYSEIARADVDPPAIPELTERERECLKWLANGKSRWEISQILRLSENTIRFHVKNAFRKLDANNRVLAVVKAVRYRLIPLWDNENYPIG
jgi:LuxR family quorum-sensing system transcriptional regulator CciR